MPPPVKDEAAQLLAFADAQREAVRLTAHGLTEDQARLTPSASVFSIGGLLKHVSWTERGWVAMARGVDLPERPGYDTEFTLSDDETLAGMLELSEQVGRETTAAVAELGLAHTFPNPKGVPWFPADVDEWDVRWLVLHLVEELARHAGHGDVVRESIDGVVMADVVGEVEGWVMPDWAG
ncbi:MAG: DinB family protein [Nocardioidaceae bacterium]|nr:DinB family protein [Nocardioidaceae bacterium]